MNRPEQALQKQAVQLVDLSALRDVFAFAPDPGIFTVGKDEAAKIHARKIGGIRKGMGVRAGVPDLVFLTKGRPFGVEFKSPNGTPSDAQKEVMATLGALDINTYIVRSIEEFVTALRCEGVDLRARVMG